MASIKKNGQIDLTALRECTDSIRANIERLDAGDDDSDSESELVAARAREWRHPSKDIAARSVDKDDLLRLGLTRSFQEDLKRLSNEETINCGEFSEEDASSSSDSMFLQFHSSDLRYTDDAFNVGTSRAQIEDMLAKFKTEARTDLAQEIVDWFAIAAANSQGIEDELDQHESVCMRQEETMDEALRDIGIQLQNRDVQTIQYMKRFYGKIQELRPKDVPRVATSPSGAVASGGARQRGSEMERVQAAAPDAAPTAAGRPGQPRAPSAAPRQALAGPAASEAQPTAASVEDDEDLTPMLRGDHSVRFEEMPEVLAEEPGEAAARVSVRQSQGHASKDRAVQDRGAGKAPEKASPRGNKAVQEDDMATIALDLLEVIAQQQDEIAHLKTRNDLSSKSAESMRNALDYIRNQRELANDREMADDGDFSDGADSVKGAGRRDNSVLLSSAAKGLINDLRDQLKVKVVGDYIMTREGRETLRGMESLSSSLSAQLRTAELMEESAELRTSVKELEATASKSLVPAKRIEVLRKEVEARQAELDRSCERKRALSKQGSNHEISGRTSQFQAEADGRDERSPSPRPRPMELLVPESPATRPSSRKGSKRGPHWLAEASPEAVQQIETIYVEVEKTLRGLQAQRDRFREGLRTAKLRIADEEEDRSKGTVNFSKQDAELETMREKLKESQHSLVEVREEAHMLVQEEDELRVQLKKVRESKKQTAQATAAASRAEGKLLARGHRGSVDVRRSSVSKPQRQASISTQAEGVQSASEDCDGLPRLTASHNTPRSSTTAEKQLHRTQTEVTEITGQIEKLQEQKAEMQALVERLRNQQEEVRTPGRRRSSGGSAASSAPRPVLGSPAPGSDGLPSQGGGAAVPGQRAPGLTPGATPSPVPESPPSPVPGVPPSPLLGGPRLPGAVAGSEAAPGTLQGRSGAVPGPPTVTRGAAPGLQASSMNATLQTLVVPHSHGGNPRPVSPANGGAVQAATPIADEAELMLGGLSAGQHPQRGASPSSVIPVGPGHVESAAVPGGHHSRKSPESGASRGSPPVGCSQWGPSPTAGTPCNEGAEDHKKVVKTIVVDKREEQVQDLLMYQSEYMRLNKQIEEIEERIREAKLKSQGKTSRGGISDKQSAVMKSLQVPEENRAKRREVTLKQRELNMLRKRWWNDKMHQGEMGNASFLGQAENAVKMLLLKPLDVPSKGLLSSSPEPDEAEKPGSLPERLQMDAATQQRPSLAPGRAWPGVEVPASPVQQPPVQRRHSIHPMGMGMGPTPVEGRRLIVSGPMQAPGIAAAAQQEEDLAPSSGDEEGTAADGAQRRGCRIAEEGAEWRASVRPNDQFDFVVRSMTCGTGGCSRRSVLDRGPGGGHRRGSVLAPPSTEALMKRRQSQPTFMHPLAGGGPGRRGSLGSVLQSSGIQRKRTSVDKSGRGGEKGSAEEEDLEEEEERPKVRAPLPAAPVHRRLLQQPTQTWLQDAAGAAAGDADVVGGRGAGAGHVPAGGAALASGLLVTSPLAGRRETATPPPRCSLLQL